MKIAHIKKLTHSIIYLEYIPFADLICANIFQISLWSLFYFSKIKKLQ